MFTFTSESIMLNHDSKDENMKQIKVLPLDGWMKFTPHRHMESQRYYEIPLPPTGRNAVFFDRKSNFCWFEKDGVSYTSDQGMSKEYFNLRLASIDGANISKKEYELSKALISTLGKKDIKLKDILSEKVRMYAHLQSIREIVLSGKKSFLQRKKKLKELKNVN